MEIIKFLNTFKNCLDTSAPFLFWKFSKSILEILKILKKEGFIRYFTLTQFKKQVFIKIYTNFDKEQKRQLTFASKNSPQKIFFKNDFWKSYGKTGSFLVLTSQGVRSDRTARFSKQGGVILFFIC